MAWCGRLSWRFAAAFVLFTQAFLVASLDDEFRLVHHLLTEQQYSSLIRPSRNISDTVKVSIAMELVQIIHIDERNQEMKTNVWLPMNWIDHRLAWDLQEFGGMHIIRLLPFRVWRPDIVILNNADAQYDVSYQSNVLVESGGQVTWVPPTIYRTSCTINVEFFPFDEQVCEIKLGSWFYDSTEVTYAWKTSCVVWFNSYLESGVWYVMDARGAISQDMSRPPKAYVSYKITLRRRVLFYTINTLIPVAMISLLTMTVFYIPVEEGEKITTGICITVSLAVFFTLLAKLLPATSVSVSLMSKYLLFTLITNVLAIFVTIIIINWNYRTPRTHQMPKWVRLIFLRHLPKLLLMKRLDHIVEEELAETIIERGRKREVLNNETKNGWSSPAFSDEDSGCLEFAYPAYTSPVVFRPRKLFSAQCSDEESERKHSLSLQSATQSPDRGKRDDCTRKKAPKLTLVGAHRKLLSFDESFDREQMVLTPTAVTLKVQDRDAKNFTLCTLNAINFMAQHLDLETEYGTVLDEWKFVAAVIDRVQLFVFLLASLIGSVYFIMKTPYLFEDVNQLRIIENLKNESESAFACSV